MQDLSPRVTEIINGLIEQRERTPSRKRMDRKGQIEMTLVQAERLVGTEEAPIAWQRLCRELRFMSEPEARMPRFSNLLRTVWIAATNEC